MELGEPDASGRRRPIPIEGSEFIIKLDRLIIGIGQKSDIPKEFDVETNKRGNIVIKEETLETSRRGVFAGGDLVSGPASVIEAIQAGRIAASSIDKYLGGNGEIEQKLIPDEEENPYIGREEGFADKKRAKNKKIPVKKRISDFHQVKFRLDEKTAIEEAKRCLKCQLRLKISKAPLPPIKSNLKSIKH